MRVGLVLGGGGMVGEAYHRGVLRALHLQGWDARTATSRLVSTLSPGQDTRGNYCPVLSLDGSHVAFVSRDALVPSPTSHRPRRPTRAGPRAMPGRERGASARSPDTTAVASGLPQGSRTACITLTCGTAGRSSLR